jgi:ubiquinone biosynthesis protein
MPVLLHHILRQAQQGELPLVIRNNDLQGIREELRDGMKRLAFGVGGTFIVVGIGIIAALEHQLNLLILDLPLWSWLLILPSLTWLINRWISSFFRARG